MAAVNAALLLAVALIAELVFGAWVEAPGLWTLSIQRDFAIRGWQQEKYLRDAPMLYSRDYYGFRGNSHALEAINIIAMGARPRMRWCFPTRKPGPPNCSNAW